MSTISAHKRKDGSVAYRRVRVMQDGVTYHGTGTFDRRPAAADVAILFRVLFPQMRGR